MMVSQSSSAVRARELLLLKPNGNLDFPFLGSGKMYSPGGGKAFKILVLLEFIAEGKFEISSASLSSRTFN